MPSEQAHRSHKQPLIIKHDSENLHKRNPWKGQYPFAELIKIVPELKQRLIRNPRGEQTIRFDDPVSVMLLNRALLSSRYDIKDWSVPEGFLCPGLPGRADYVIRLAEILYRELPQLRQQQVSVLDTGTGASGIYPLIGAARYGWHFKASDIDPRSLAHFRQILNSNPGMKEKIALAQQSDAEKIFKGIIGSGERYHLTLCNPPFHSSAAAAATGSQRKQHNLRAGKGKSPGTGQSEQKSGLNFGGRSNELWCPGGELRFIDRMAAESRNFRSQVLWFSSLVSKKENVRPIRKQLEKLGADTIHIARMAHGHKVSRFIAWSFHSAEQRQRWQTDDKTGR